MTLGPTVAQRLLRFVGTLPIPRIEGAYARLGVLAGRSPRHFSIAFHGLEYNGRMDQAIDRHIFYFGAYAPAELDFLSVAARALRRERGTVTFVDVGANVGQHSLFMTQHADRIVAFEPNAVAADQFEHNLRRNGVLNTQVVRCALGDVDAVGTLGSGFEGNDGSRSLLWSLDQSKDTVVSVREAGETLAKTGIGRLDLLKLDVEGYERKVLVGLMDSLQRDRPIILFELIGSDTKGGFTSEDDLRSVLYPDHCLFTLPGGRKARLARFDW
jgi:FkbM family methyltransferase